MWTDYYLKAPNREAFNMTCPWMGEDGEPLTDSTDHSLVVVGQIRYGGVYDAEGNETVAPTVVEGWHVNLRLRSDVALPEALARFVMPVPAYPKRVFA